MTGGVAGTTKCWRLRRGYRSVRLNMYHAPLICEVSTVRLETKLSADGLNRRPLRRIQGEHLAQQTLQLAESSATQ